MRICVLADTHLNVPLGVNAVNEMGEVDLFVHLGDCYVDAVKINEETGVPFKAVPGNKDWHADVPETIFWEVEGVKIMATHGHIVDVCAYDQPDVCQEKFMRMAKVAKDNDAQMILYGHNHKAEKFYLDDILFFNPGELTYGTYRCTYGILEINNGQISAELVEIKSNSSIGR